MITEPRTIMTVKLVWTVDTDWTEQGRPGLFIICASPHENKVTMGIMRILSEGEGEV